MDENIAGGFNEYFVSILNSGVFDRTDLNYTKVFRLHDVFDELLVKTIYSIILKMKDTYSVRFDQLPAELLKWCPDRFASLLYPFVDSIILAQTYPDVWKLPFVLVLFKRENKFYVYNYRSISQLPILSFIFEKILFFIYQETKQMISSKQFGFQSRRSAVV